MRQPPVGYFYEGFSDSPEHDAPDDALPAFQLLRTSEGLSLAQAWLRLPGKAVRTAQFADHVEKAAGKKARDFLQGWLQKPGLPKRPAGGPFSVLTFYPEVEEALIVQGTADEEEANAEAALALQKALLRRGHNVLVPIRKDTEVTAEELKSHHLLLVGRPSTNRLTDRLSTLSEERCRPRKSVSRSRRPVQSHPTVANPLPQSCPSDG